MEPKIVAWGFQLDTDTLHFIQGELSEFLEFCPDDSTANFKIAKGPTHYEIVARIYYDGGGYTAKARSLILTGAIHEVIDQLYEQVHTWRRKRNFLLGVEQTPPTYE